MTNTMTIQNEVAISATRLQDWTIQLSYGGANRKATPEEGLLLDKMWDGDTDGDGNPWVAL
jgi:hypothetical protein